MTTEPTACRKCCYSQHIVKNEAAPELWYNWQCVAGPREERFDCIDGYTIRDPAYCRDINTDGKCPFYKEKD